MFKGNQLLSQAVVHHDRKVLKVADLQVAQGDTLDFVADIGGTLAYDQFLWDIRIEVAGQQDRFWHASDDFVGPPVESLSPWEQLVQVLMSANEFAYID